MAASKYHNRKAKQDGHTFDSLAERERYRELKRQQGAGEIEGLEVHPRFLLQEGFRDEVGRWHRAIHYEADFQYVEQGHAVVEDVKGIETDVFKLKMKLLLYKYPALDFRIIKARRGRRKVTGGGSDQGRRSL